MAIFSSISPTQWPVQTVDRWLLKNPVMPARSIAICTDGRYKVGSTGALTFAEEAWGVGGGVSADSSNVTISIFGTGGDGDLNMSGGRLVLGQDAHFKNLSLSGGQIYTSGLRIFVSEILNLANAVTGAINFNGISGTAGVGGVAGTGGAAILGVTVGGSTLASAGKAGSTGNGQAGSGGTVGNLGGSSGSSGAGGAGSAGTAGAFSVGSAITNNIRFAVPDPHIVRGVTLQVGGAGAPSAGSGGGDGTTVGRASGGGGAGGGVIYISARSINRDGTTAAGTIQCQGGNAGAGGTGATGNTGGAGGSSGGGGGYILLIYASLTGSTVTNLLNCDAGASSAGSDGAGTGVGGNGGAGSVAGNIQLVCMDGTSAYYTPATCTSGSAPTAGSAASGTTGGAAGTSGTCRQTL